MGIRTNTIAIAGLVIAVVLFSALLVPIVASSTTSTETRENTGTLYYDTGAASISFDGSKYYLGETELTSIGSLGLLAIGEHFYLDKTGIKYYHDNTVDRLPFSSETPVPWTFTLAESGAIDFVCGEQTLSGYSDAKTTIHNVNSGPYVRVVTGSDFYVNTNSSIAAYDVGSGFSVAAMTYGMTMPKESVSLAYPTNNDTGRLTTASFTLTETDDSGVYTVSGTANNKALVLIVPVEYTAYTTASGTVYTIIGVLPIIALLGIVMAAAYFAANRD